MIGHGAPEEMPSKWGLPFVNRERKVGLNSTIGGLTSTCGLGRMNVGPELNDMRGMCK